jgi:CheY-like chemotaxis protein
LGLTISLQLVKLMGGEIGIESREGEGSRFFFELAFPKTSSEATVSEAADQSGPTANGHDGTLRHLGRPLSILLVDDNRINRMVGEHLIKSQGWSVQEAEDGEQAVDAVRNGLFDLVLMDVQMPVMDGISATRAIRALEEKRGGHLPIIALTAHAIKGERERLLATGMDDYVSKPIIATELFAAILRQVHNEELTS